jgi:hypothetical protein
LIAHRCFVRAIAALACAAAVALWLFSSYHAPARKAVENSAGISVPFWTPIQTVKRQWNGPFGESIFKVTVGTAPLQMFDRTRCRQMLSARAYASILAADEFAGGYDRLVCVMPMAGGGDRDMLIIDRDTVFVIYSD